jgi:hypothetical protein
MTATLIYSRRKKTSQWKCCPFTLVSGRPFTSRVWRSFPNTVAFESHYSHCAASPFVNAACLAAPLSRGRRSHSLCVRLLRSHNAAPVLQIRFIVVFSILKKDVYDPLASNAAWTLRCDIAASVCCSLFESVVLLYVNPGRAC